MESCFTLLLIPLSSRSLWFVIGMLLHVLFPSKVINPSYILPAKTWVTHNLFVHISWKNISTLLAEELLKKNLNLLNCVWPSHLHFMRTNIRHKGKGTVSRITVIKYMLLGASSLKQHYQLDTVQYFQPITDLSQPCCCCLFYQHHFWNYWNSLSPPLPSLKSWIGPVLGKLN